ncbi:hypothetical protein [Bradyrhizobium roseum]|uniref:hypothetical protein n=1 Tax=Bradyrhizobium roseum TaxID=3056648 RepID=UPI0026241E83|nr:hypothetical protein [Bradyrhizobium roseus]WKA29168.1 hypothetical protein QUH67_02930 [Bradyrhizobium roseus]
MPGTAPPDTPSAAAENARFWQIVRRVGAFAFVVVVLVIGYLLMRYGYDGVSGRNSESQIYSYAAVQEWQLARADHEMIAAAAAACSNIQDLDAQPDFVRAALRLDILPSDVRRQSAVRAPDQKAANSLVLSNYQRAIVYLSDSIKRNRIESASAANRNYTSMFWFQLAIVGIGAITTILISIKSIAPAGETPSTNNLSLWVGILAIVFSSLGTATSALNSFYAPRESYLKSERSLAALRQLHSDIATKIASTTFLPPEKCPKLDPKIKDDPYAKQVQDWTTRLGAILNATDSGSSQNTSSTAGPNSPKVVN